MLDNDNPKRTTLKWLLGSISLPATTFVSRCVGICLIMLAAALASALVIWVAGAFLLPAIL